MSHQNCFKKTHPRPAVYENTDKVKDILNMASSLTQDEYHELCMALVKMSPCNRQQRNTLKNHITDTNKVYSTLTKPLEASGQQRKVDPRAHSSMSKLHNAKWEKQDFKGDVEREVGEASGQQRTVDPSATSLIANSLSASKVTLICRGDLIAEESVVFMDVEKIIEAGTHKNLAGDVAIVSEKGVLLFWSYVRRDAVCRFNTKMTGLDKNKMSKGLSIDTVQEIFSKILKDKILYGADFKNDWESLGYDKNRIPFIIRDIQDFYRDKKGNPISLALLSLHFLGENAQEVIHSSIRDARVTAICYKRMMTLKKEGFATFDCPVFDEQRSATQKNKTQFFERCGCGATKNKKSGKKPQGNLSGWMNVDLNDF